MVHYSHLKNLAFPCGSKTSQAKFMFICDIHTAFCKDQQFGKHHMRIKKIHFDFVVE